MTWPEVLPALAVVVGAAASLFGVALALRRLFRPWVADVARTEADRVGAKVEALADKLASNDFPHLEARIEKRLAEAKKDRAAMREDFGGRLTEARKDFGERLDRMESRILAALSGRGEDPKP